MGAPRCCLYVTQLPGSVKNLKTENWVPKMLTAEMKESYVTNSYALLVRYNYDPEDFHVRLV